MIATMATEEVSLRPMALRPGGGGKTANAFAAFGKGAGASLSKRVSSDLEASVTAAARGYALHQPHICPPAIA